MKKEFFAKLFLTILMLAMTVVLSSCGKNDDFSKELGALKINMAFPEATNNAKTLEEAEEEIRTQQAVLARGYYDAYTITETDLYTKKYGRISTERITKELSDARNRLNGISTAQFSSKLKTILENVTDCSNKEVYITKRIEDVKGFYSDYIKMQSYTESDYKAVTEILVNNYNGNNEFAKWMLKEEESFVLECATLMIEENGNTASGYMANLQKNNQIVTALNGFYGGVNPKTNHLDRIKKANNKLTSYLSNASKKRAEQLSRVEVQD